MIVGPEAYDRRETDRIADSFSQMVPLVSAYYDFPELKRAELLFSFEDRPPKLRSFPMQVQDSRHKPTFITFMQDYEDFLIDFRHFMGDNPDIQSYGVDTLARELYVGCGLVQPAIEQDVIATITRKPKNKKQIKELFTDKSDIEELFFNLFPQDPEEIDPVWSLTRYIGDDRTSVINSTRAKLEYFWNVMDNQHGEGLHNAVIETALLALVKQLTVEERPFYLDLGEMGFHISEKEYNKPPVEVCNEVFMDRLSEWLVAMCLPMDTRKIQPRKETD